MNYPESINKLIEYFSSLPGIGPKSAEKLTFFILNAPDNFVNEFSEILRTIKNRIKKCKICGNYSENDVCPICSDPKRDKSLLCVVERPQDIISIEKLNIYNGLYHVLFGVISPLDGIGPDELNLNSLIKRIKEENIKELIIATNPTPDGDTTAIYISKLLKDSNIKITRIAYGIPAGAHIDYTDMVTLTRSFLNRQEL